ncbi:hypothetical protein CASFOL_022148 [Castilleja foliolosa]|uniref:F-box domain-containing protein n=1 Tax=Castilleja foliolosa TaxID=1961234 RepID=A0ABD3D1B7_9LAMI
MDKQQQQQLAERDEDEDRISELPQPILHHILTFLTQKGAVKTSVLSKSWRHLWSSSPKITFLQYFFNGNNETFLSVLNTTLQRYLDRNLSIHQFRLQLTQLDPQLSSLLEKWVPILITELGIKILCLELFPNNSSSDYFEMPSVESESLNELYLIRCKLAQISSKHLKTLYFDKVFFTDETLEKTLSACPLVEHLTLYNCGELRIVKVNKPCNLKCFEFVGGSDYDPEEEADDDLRSIEIDAPTLETLRILNMRNWYNHNKHVFPFLVNLRLSKVKLSKESFFDTFSSNFPCVEKLVLKCCSGFEELELVSRSIKSLKIMFSRTKVISKVVVNAPNLVIFEYRGFIPPSAISVTTTSSEWKSSINLSYLQRDALLSWLLKLNEMLKALSRSDISVEISYWPHENEPVEHIGGDLCEPVVVGQLELLLVGSPSLSLGFVDNMFRVCRPRKMRQYWNNPRKMRQYWNNDTNPLLMMHWEVENQTTEYLWKVLVNERERGPCFWQWDLEEVRVEVWDEKGQKWDPLRGTSLMECVSLLPNDPARREVCFQLKWICI